MIFLVAEINDPTVNFLEERIKERKISYLRINVETFPETEVTYQILPKNNNILTLGRNEVPSSSVTGIFSRFRRPISQELLVPIPIKNKEFVGKELKDLLLFTLLSCQNARWVNSLQSSVLASVKINQLRLADTIGLNTPETLISSCKKKLLQFWQRKNGKVVFKAIHQGWVAKGKDGITHTVLFTNIVQESHFGCLKDNNYPPYLFQEMIDKKIELRIVIVERFCFACQLGNTNQIDWRKDMAVTKNSIVYLLPEEIKEKCVRLVSLMGLSFGVIDMIVNQQGCYFFLEVNPQGGWLWMEQLLRYPIRDTLIDYLAGLG